MGGGVEARCGRRGWDPTSTASVPQGKAGLVSLCQKLSGHRYAAKVPPLLSGPPLLRGPAGPVSLLFLSMTSQQAA